jgi:hypothetical protein
VDLSVASPLFHGKWFVIFPHVRHPNMTSHSRDETRARQPNFSCRFSDHGHKYTASLYKHRLDYDTVVLP